MQISIYWRTLKYLKPVQIYRRIWFLLYKPRAPIVSTQQLATPLSAWRGPAKKIPSVLSASKLKFLNRTEDIGTVGWHGEGVSKLWCYNQHYFDDLNSVNAKERHHWHETLISSWIDKNMPGEGVGWEPYPTSLRVVNWCKYFLSGVRPSERQLKSLSTQCEWLTRRLEYHLLGNHLFANAKALYVAGCFLDGKLAQKWFKLGRSIIDRELTEQILADGGHFELSPMYHAIVLEDMLDLVNMARTFGEQEDAKRWSKYIVGMIQWLQVMRHPDGGIAFFNDAAFEIAPSNFELLDYATRLGFNVANKTVGSKYLIESGFARLENRVATVLCDIGRVGPEYLPGHAHADTLSFECSLFGQRVFVNSGTSTYDVSSERCRQRSTSAHNALVINRENSSEVWSSFRVAGRAYPFGRDVVFGFGIQSVKGAHSGYHRLKGKPTHSRSWTLCDDYLELEDVVIGSFDRAEVYYHCHPAVMIDQNSKSENSLTLRLKSQAQVTMTVEGASVEVISSTWHPKFGLSIENKVIVLLLTDERCVVTISF